MKEPSDQFGRVLASVMLRTDISPESRLVYAILATYAGAKRTCFPSRQTLADTVGKSVRTISYALAELEEKGVIRRNIQEGKPTVYELLTLATDCKGSVAMDSKGEADCKGTLATEQHEPLQPDSTYKESIEREGESAPKKNPKAGEADMPVKDDPPTLEDVTIYGACVGVPERECQAYHQHYTGLGWRTAGGGIIYDWRPLLMKWHATEKSRSTHGSGMAGVRRGGGV